jgi:hypothetical protein
MGREAVRNMHREVVRNMVRGAVHSMGPEVVRSMGPEVVRSTRIERRQPAHSGGRRRNRIRKRVQRMAMAP